ncbi:MAG: hybrid sensor histidine kinase/response regulator [Candidatus Dormibacteraceae bacterium]
MGEIEDEFRPLFIEEAKCQLERIASGLLVLEASPGDQAAIAGILREAHTMKGAAGMVGMMRVSHLIHRLEDLLVELRAGARRSSPELTDLMLQFVDGLGRLIAGMSSGQEDISDDAPLASLLPEPKPIAEAAVDPRLFDAVSAVAAPAPLAVAPAQPGPAPATGQGSTSPSGADAPPVFPQVEKKTELVPPPAPITPASNGHSGRRQGDSATLQVPVARIDELNRLVGEASAAQLRVGHAFGSELHLDPDAVTEYRELTKVINQLQEVTERTRMVPVGTLEPVLHRTVRDSARAAGKNVRWEMEGEDIEVDRGVLEALVSPLLHLIRNAVGHGVESAELRRAAGKPEQAVVRVHATQVGSKVIISISDDGAGINVAAVRAAAARGGADVSGLTEEESLHLIFRPGTSTAKVLTESSGRGVGLDVVVTAVAAVHGAVEVVNHPGAGAEFRIVVPITLTVVPCLIVSIAGQSFALPLHRIIRMLEAQQVQLVSGKMMAVVDGVAVPVYNLASLLGLQSTDGGPWVLLGTETNAYAFQVERVIQKRDVVVRGLTGRLRDLKSVSGASIEPNGSILLVLDVSNLIERSSNVVESATRIADKPVERALSVVVVDDALMVRELQRSILERAGYNVRTATDGSEAIAMLAEQPADLVVTDLEMPNMNGFNLTKSIRAHPRLANIPVLIVTSRASAEDHQLGLDAGADGYIVKTAFDEAGLLTAVSRLLGRSGERAGHNAADATSVKTEVGRHPAQSAAPR